MKSVKHMFSVVMVVVFMVPATGFIYTRHTCQQSDRTQIVLDHEYTCGTVIEETCCESVQQEQSCCSNDSEYLKVEYEYTAPNKAHSFEFEITLTIALLPGYEQAFANSQTRTQHNSQPVFHPPADILRQHSAFLL